MKGQQTLIVKVNLKKMKTQKINLEAIKSSLSRGEMKKIMAGSGEPGGYYKCCNYQNCTSCGTSTWVPSGSNGICQGGAWKCAG
ncbi:hypothetical protein [Pedobacter psychrotolerans]|uniref:Natural product n=1 Tax=Pedobacter psychrotolerans TaxID=1843235 RepID=A0ABQ1SS73_9SPHI|nr:hypothetical protein [Pedobacter psychrotolerans]GGE51786.1 hypothetical protein GCM10011413_17660 [Pedobacter psychrotolerans]